ncbi:hypothetical protein [Halobellus rubicundus]|uniref:DUF885 domain-containing protein n=1 Tax=Halobellus rubicundus TaxID=2996466 RepID=A0ABD5ME45_9EURY
MTRRTRRQMLAATGTAIAGALAGCGGVGDAVLGGDDDTLSYDHAALTDLAERPPPTPPTAFPLSIPASAFDRHRSRIRALLDEVPESPDLPNEALAAELAERRSSVTDRFRDARGNETGPSGGSESEYLPDRTAPRERLGDLRSVRADAAGINAAYRAAIGRVDGEELRSRRERVRSDLYDFLRSWTYDGASALEALLVHNHIEGLVESVRRSLREPASFPEAPRDEAFAVSDLAASVEYARASLADATSLRGTYRESVADPTSYRDAIESTAGRLVEQHRITSAHADVHEYEDLDEPPFARSIEETPAGELYRHARELVGDDFVEGRGLERQPASRCLQAAVGLAALQTFRTVVEEIDAGNYGVPETVAPIAEARGDAVDALRMVWTGEPQALRLELDWPATDMLLYQLREFHEDVADLDDGEVSTYTINETYGGLLYAYHYATYVPPVADHLLAVLREQ